MSHLRRVIRDVTENFAWGSRRVRPTRWQGQDVSQRPEAQMMEDLHVHIEANLEGVEDLAAYRLAVQPNLPWADNHFLERVCGYPINPGVEWANWPWGVNAEKSLDENGQFNHNYMERYWPRLAHVSDFSENVHDFKCTLDQHDQQPLPITGIRHEYGDLGGLVRDLAGEPDTRQAYLPVWFPEDTGDAHKGRKPCTLGYHFIMRNEKLDVVYYLRSCDLAHHFRDDVYLTIRLLLWVLDECRKIDPSWQKIKPGRLVMQVTSLHMFINDFKRLYPED